MMFIATVLASVVPVALATIHDIQVGGPGGLVYDPPAIAAQPGDQVVFHFHPKAHSVTQSSFANPCGPKEGGFDSQLMPVPANQTDQFPTWTLTVNDTNPTWAYCKAAAGTADSHCGKGMVFAINCGPDGSANSFTGFRESALKIGQSLAAQASSSAGSGYGVPASASTPTAASPSPSSSGGAVEHKVIVGGTGKLAFDPEWVAAQPGDTIAFEFHQKNHSVTASTFGTPCVKKAGGLDAGFWPVADNATEFPTWKVVVNDTTPLWFFCAQGTHCSAGGMVFAVNSDETAGSSRSLAAFKLAATSGASSSSAASTNANNGALATHFNGAIMGLSLLTVAAFFLQM